MLLVVASIFISQMFEAKDEHTLEQLQIGWGSIERKKAPKIKSKHALQITAVFVSIVSCFLNHPEFTILSFSLPFFLKIMKIVRMFCCWTKSQSQASLVCVFCEMFWDAPMNLRMRIFREFSLSLKSFQMCCRVSHIHLPELRHKKERGKKKWKKKQGKDA